MATAKELRIELRTAVTEWDVVGHAAYKNRQDDMYDRKGNQTALDEATRKAFDLSNELQRRISNAMLTGNG